MYGLRYTLPISWLGKLNTYKNNIYKQIIIKKIDIPTQHMSFYSFTDSKRRLTYRLATFS